MLKSARHSRFLCILTVLLLSLLLLPGAGCASEEAPLAQSPVPVPSLSPTAMPEPIPEPVPEPVPIPETPPANTENEAPPPAEDGGPWVAAVAAAGVAPYVVQIIFGASDNGWRSLSFTSPVRCGIICTSRPR